MKYVMSYKYFHYVRHHLFLHFLGVTKWFSGLWEPSTALIRNPVVTPVLNMSSGTMHYLTGSLIASRITRPLTVSRADESRGSLDIRRLHRPPAVQFPPHHRSGQYRFLSIRRWWGRNGFSSPTYLHQLPAGAPNCQSLQK